MMKFSTLQFFANLSMFFFCKGIFTHDNNPDHSPHGWQQGNTEKKSIKRFCCLHYIRLITNEC